MVLARLLASGGDGVLGSKRVNDFVDIAEGLVLVDPVDAFFDIILVKGVGLVDN